MQFDVFNAIERLIKFETFYMVVLSDVWPLYMYTHSIIFPSNEFVLYWLHFYLKSVTFLFLFSIGVLPGDLCWVELILRIKM